MLNPVTKIFIKIFVRGFYRNHAGALLFFFITIFSYCFFIQVLNQTHLEPAERIVQNLLFVITLLTSPPLLLVVFLGWIGFTIKSYKYIISQLSLPANQFLFYSCTTLKKIELFKSWFTIQFLISVPLNLFAVFALIVGIVYKEYTAPAVIIVFIVGLNSIPAFFLTTRFSQVVNIFSASIISKIAQSWPKPAWSLFVYQTLINLPLTFFLTKIFSFSIGIGLNYLLANIDDTFTRGGLIVLGISVAHSFLVFESYRFERSQISFVRNFPWRRSKIYRTSAATFGILLIPEAIWLLIQFKLSGLLFLPFGLGICLLFRSFLYRIELDMKAFLYFIFFVFIIIFIGILYHFLSLLIPLVLVSSWIIFANFYDGKRFKWINLNS